MAKNVYETLLVSRPTNWLRHAAKYARGMYASIVKGRIPDDVENELIERGLQYRPRDQTDVD